jgi:phospholipid/cholesterol/gamma-HCH transport system permease protein
MAFLESRRDGNLLELTLRGSWRAASIAPIRAEAAALDLAGVGEVLISGRGVERLDLAGAWALDDLTRQLAVRDVSVRFSDGEPQALTLVRSALHADPAARPRALQEEVSYNAVGKLGRTAVERLQEVRDGMEYVGHTAVVFARALVSWKRLRPISVARHVYDTGITAIPIVSLMRAMCMTRASPRSRSFR